MATHKGCLSMCIFMFVIYLTVHALFEHTEQSRTKRTECTSAQTHTKQIDINSSYFHTTLSPHLFLYMPFNSIDKKLKLMFDKVLNTHCKRRNATINDQSLFPMLPFAPMSNLFLIPSHFLSLFRSQFMRAYI